MNPRSPAGHFAALSWPAAMSAWLPTRFLPADAVSAATPLAAASAAADRPGGRSPPSPRPPTVQRRGRCGDLVAEPAPASPLGLNARGAVRPARGLARRLHREAPVLLLAAGAAVLLWRRIIRWRFPRPCSGSSRCSPASWAASPRGRNLAGRCGVPPPLGGIVLAGFYMAPIPSPRPYRWGGSPSAPSSVRSPSSSGFTALRWKGSSRGAARQLPGPAARPVDASPEVTRMKSESRLAPRLRRRWPVRRPARAHRRDRPVARRRGHGLFRPVAVRRGHRGAVRDGSRRVAPCRPAPRRSLLRGPHRCRRVRVRDRSRSLRLAARGAPDLGLYLPSP